MELVFTLEEIAETAKKVLAAAKKRPVFALHGEMGAGKTTFVHAMCEVLGVSGHVSSPTFSIINQYTTGSGEIIYHLDLYRIKDEAEAISAGVEECLFSGNTCLVEWPEKAPGVFPDDALHLFITAVNSNTRRIIAGQL